MAAHIRVFLKAGNLNACVFEDWSVKAGDPNLSSSKSHILTFHGEVYYVLFGGDVEDSRIETTVAEARRLPVSFGVMTSVPDEASNVNMKAGLDCDLLRSLAERTERIVVGAYDGESYLIWYRLSPAES